MVDSWVLEPPGWLLTQWNLSEMASGYCSGLVSRRRDLHRKLVVYRYQDPCIIWLPTCSSMGPVLFAWAVLFISVVALLPIIGMQLLFLISCTMPCSLPLFLSLCLISIFLTLIEQCAFSVALCLWFLISEVIPILLIGMGISHGEPSPWKQTPSLLCLFLLRFISTLPSFPLSRLLTDVLCS